MSTEPLERELRVYRAKLPALAASEGKFALVHDDDYFDVLDSYQDALKVGYEKFGLQPFLVKKISSMEAVYFLNR